MNLKLNQHVQNNSRYSITHKIINLLFKSIIGISTFLCVIFDIKNKIIFACLLHDRMLWHSIIT